MNDMTTYLELNAGKKSELRLLRESDKSYKGTFDAPEPIENPALRIEISEDSKGSIIGHLIHTYFQIITELKDRYGIMIADCQFPYFFGVGGLMMTSPLDEIYSDGDELKNLKTAITEILNKINK